MPPLAVLETAAWPPAGWELLCRRPSRHAPFPWVSGSVELVSATVAAYLSLSVPSRPSAVAIPPLVLSTYLSPSPVWPSPPSLPSPSSPPSLSSPPSAAAAPFPPPSYSAHTHVRSPAPSPPDPSAVATTPFFSFLACLVASWRMLLSRRSGCLGRRSSGLYSPYSFSERIGSRTQGTLLPEFHSNFDIASPCLCGRAHIDSDRYLDDTSCRFRADDGFVSRVADFACNRSMRRMGGSRNGQKGLPILYTSLHCSLFRKHYSRVGYTMASFLNYAVNLHCLCSSPEQVPCSTANHAQSSHVLENMPWIMWVGASVQE